MLRYRLFPLTALVIGTACGLKSSGNILPASINSTVATHATTAARTPYTRLQFSPAEIKVLDDQLPESVRQILERANEIEVFSISSDAKTVLVKDAATKSELLDAFYDGIIKPDPTAACFWPHHGFRVKDGTYKVEIEICFICKNFKVYTRKGDKFAGRISSAPEVIFNRILDSSGNKIKPLLDIAGDA